MILANLPADIIAQPRPSPPPLPRQEEEIPPAQTGTRKGRKWLRESDDPEPQTSPAGTATSLPEGAGVCAARRQEVACALLWSKPRASPTPVARAGCGQHSLPLLAAAEDAAAAYATVHVRVLLVRTAAFSRHLPWRGQSFLSLSRLQAAQKMGLSILVSSRACVQGRRLPWPSCQGKLQACPLGRVSPQVPEVSQALGSAAVPCRPSPGSSRVHAVHTWSFESLHSLG